jgi:glycosyltransferase involved in cell wall biosynthesis
VLILFINQTYKSLEIILVDDGSTDNSAQICDDYAEKDQRVIAVHQSNSGVSSARNKGIEICKGDYIAFIDSDDYVKADYLESLFDSVNKDGADISVCDYCIVSNEQKREHRLGKYGCFEIEDFLPEYLTLSVETDECWESFFSRAAVADNIFENFRVSEDSLFVFRCFLNAKKISIINKSLYCYRQNNDGTIRLADAAKRYEACITAEIMLDFCKANWQHNRYIPFANDRQAKYNFFVYFFAKNEKDSAIANKCKEYIVKNRRSLLSTKGVSTKVKCACATTLFGFWLTGFLYKLINR